MIEVIQSGMQTGADFGAILAAVELKIPTTGYMPLGFRTEDGNRPEYKDLYNAVEHFSRDYPPRTIKNIEESDATLVFKAKEGPGTNLTIRQALKLKKPVFVIGFDPKFQPSRKITEIIKWLDTHNIKVLNVAGNRESNCPGLEQATKNLLIQIINEYQIQLP